MEVADWGPGSWGLRAAGFQFCKMRESGIWLHDNVNVVSAKQVNTQHGRDGQFNAECTLLQLKKQS